MTVSESKAELRRSIREKRRALSQAERQYAAELVAEKLLRIPELVSARYVLAYMPMKYELDIIPAVRRLEELGVKAVFPLCIENGGLRLYLPARENGFRIGAYGILEPDESTAVLIEPGNLDAVILPAIGFDSNRNRLGQGGGYYDRLLANLDCFTVAVGFDCQLVKSVPVEEFDKTVDAVVTPGHFIGA